MNFDSKMNFIKNLIMISFLIFILFILIEIIGFKTFEISLFLLILILMFNSFAYIDFKHYIPVVEYNIKEVKGKVGVEREIKSQHVMQKESRALVFRVLELTSSIIVILIAFSLFIWG